MGDMIRFFLDSWRRYGDIVRYTAGPMAMHLLVHPDYIRQVFVDNEKNYIKGFPFRKVRIALGEGLFGTDGPQWKFAYFPFGGGPRICLGNSFALLEATMAMAAIAARYSLRLVPGQDIRPQMMGTLRPNRPVMMTLHAR
jgi:cytochrome P450